MAKNAVASRLKGNVSTTNDAGGYDLLGHLRDAGTFVATGQMPARQAPASDLDMQLKLQRLQTGNPDFQRELAQTKADADLSNAIAADEAKVEANRRRMQAAMGGQQGSPTPSPSNTPNLGPSPLGPMSQGSKVPAFIQVPKSPKYDPNTGTMIPEFDNEKNPEYLGPEDRQKAVDAEEQKTSRNEMVRSEGLSQLQALRSTKKGINFFGPMGGELPSTLMGFPNPAVGTSYPGGSKIADRTNWEANLENLKAAKMLDTMMKMKEASKTGATGFGQLSEKEGQVLMDASMKLRRNLNPEDAKPLIDQMEALQMKSLGMPLSPEQQGILDAINGGNYPASNEAPSTLPDVGGTFQGKKVLSVKRVG